MLELTDVHAGYGQTPVLRGVSMTARPGAITALLGRNGMGKTTTIRSIVGLVRASSGS
ncbi:MAG: ATP-binding cassette domain-containing protein, partial [Actinobacteria bacterium]|nr:ATP-binding cassette domain-containing protein [Actinomycetota bacterium]